MISSPTSLLLLAATFLLSSTDAFLPAKPRVSVQIPQTYETAAISKKLSNSHHDARRVPSSPTILFMGWGPDPVWSSATVTSKDSANQSSDSVLMTVSVPPETAGEYKVPGQYVQLRLNEDTKPLFLAIASAPNSENASFEFLIKKTDGNEWMTGASVGTAVQISQVLGGGFPITENIEGFKYDFPTQNVLLFAAGSGIAPIRAAIESGQLGVSGGGGRTARLYYGVRQEDDLCFVDSFSQWEGSGVQVVPVLSQPGDGWAGRTGYVQNCLEEDGVPIPRNSGALLCGMKGMAESVTDILTKAGVFEGRVLTNF
jgi:NAD(P)H-flavin reductase